MVSLRAVYDKSARSYEITEYKAAAWSPDGERIAIGGVSGEALVFGISGRLHFKSTPLRNRRVRRAHLPRATIERLAWSPDGRHLAATTSDRRVVLWRLDERRPVWERSWAAPEIAVTGICFAPDGRMFTGGAGLRAWSLDGDEPVLVAAIEDAPEPAALAWLAGAGEVAVARSDGQLLRWSPGAGTLAAWAALPGQAHQLVPGPGPGEVTAALGRAGVRVFGGGGERQLSDRFAVAVDWSPDGSRMAALTPSGRIVVHVDGAPTFACALGGSGYRGAARFSPDGGLLVAVGEERAVLWRTEPLPDVPTPEDWRSRRPRLSEWLGRGHRGAPAGHPALEVGGAPSIERILWSAKLNETQKNRPVVLGDSVVLGGLTPKLGALRRQSGARGWSDLPLRSSMGGGQAVVIPLDGGDVLACATFGVARVEAATGRLRWRSPLSAGGDGDRAAPTVVGGLVFCCQPSDRVIALDLETGDEVWCWRARDGYPGSHGVIAEDSLFLSLNKSQLGAVSIETGEVRWSVDFGRGGVALVGDHLVAAVNYEAIAVDLATGGERWRTKLGGYFPLASLAPLGEALLIWGGRSLGLLSPSTGELRWRREFDAPIAGVSVAGEHILAGVGQALLVLDAAGAEVSRREFTEAVTAPPTVSGGAVYVATSDRTLHALGGPEAGLSVEAGRAAEVGLSVAVAPSAVTEVSALGWSPPDDTLPPMASSPSTPVSALAGAPRERWVTHIGRLGRRPPVWAPEARLLLCGTEERGLVAVNLDDGDRRWRRDLPQRVSGVALAGDAVLVTYGEQVMALSLHGGRVRWRLQLPAASVGGIAVSGELAALSTRDGRVLTLRHADGAAVAERATGLRGPLHPVGAGWLGRQQRVLTLTPPTGEARTLTLPARTLEEPEQAPLVVDGELFITTEGRRQSSAVRCYALASGEAIWSAALTGGVIASPPVRLGDLVVAATHNYGRSGQAVWGLDAEDGAVRWRCMTDVGTSAALGVAEGQVLQGDTRGGLQGLRASDGEPLWRWEGRSPFTHAPLAVDGWVVTSTQLGALYGLR